VEINFTHNIREVSRGLSDFAQAQVPFATSLALNDTAEAIRKNTDKALDRRLDRPTPFTRRGLMVLRSSKRRLSAAVLFRDIQARYLAWVERGGDRPPKAKAIPVPVAIDRDRFGNMRRGAVKRTAGRPDVFAGRPGGGRLAPGLWQRTGKGGTGLRLLVAFEAVARYAPRLGFAEDAAKTARAFMPVAWERAMRRAIETARR
jgi:hypothetical protein